MIGLAAFIDFRVKPLYKIQFIKGYVDHIRGNRSYFMKLKNKIEIYFLFLIFGFTASGRGSWMHVILYINYLRVKFTIS